MELFVLSYLFMTIFTLSKVFLKNKNWRKETIICTKWWSYCTRVACTSVEWAFSHWDSSSSQWDPLGTQCPAFFAIMPYLLYLNHKMHGMYVIHHCSQLFTVFADCSQSVCPDYVQCAERLCRVCTLLLYLDLLHPEYTAAVLCGVIC